MSESSRSSRDSNSSCSEIETTATMRSQQHAGLTKLAWSSSSEKGRLAPLFLWRPFCWWNSIQKVLSETAPQRDWETIGINGDLGQVLSHASPSKLLQFGTSEGFSDVQVLVVLWIDNISNYKIFIDISFQGLEILSHYSAIASITRIPCWLANKIPFTVGSLNAYYADTRIHTLHIDVNL